MSRPRVERDDYTIFFAEVLPRVERLAARIVGPGPGAEDVAVEALARAFARWSAVKNMDHPDIWVLRVATNLALDIVRRHPPQVAVSVAGDTIADQIVQRQALLVALRQLPRRQREAVVLRYIADLPESEVASALGVSLGTIKVHLHRAMPKLRAQLGGAL